MTLPTGVWAQGSTIPRLGVVLALFPLESEFNLEIQRAPDDGGGDPDVGSAVILAVVPPSTQVAIDALQNADTTWHYRWRHSRDNYTDGAWTPWIAGRARAIPRTLPPLPRAPLLDASLSLSATNEVILELNAEPWVRSAQWEVDTSGSWPDLDDGGTTCSALDADGDATVSTSTTLANEQTARVEIRFYPEASCAGNPVGTLRLSIPFSAGPIAPQMTILQSQVGSVGTLSITVWDPDLMATNLRFAEKTDAGGYGGLLTSWDTSTGTPGASTTLSRSEAINLAAKHNVALMIVLDYTENGVAKSDSRPISFDEDLVAEITGLTVSYDTDGTVNVTPLADEDGANRYVTVGIDSTPSDPTVGVNDGTAAGRTSEISTAIVSAMGSLVVVKAVAADSGAALGPVMTKSFRRGGAANLPPTLELKPTQSGSTGSFDLVVNDPSLSVTAVEFQERAGGAAWGGSWLTSWDRSTGVAGTATSLSRGEDVTLAAKHTYGVKARVTFTDENGATKYITDEHDFDADLIAEMTGMGISFSVDDEVVVGGTADEDSANQYFTAGTSSPSDPTVGTNDGTISGRSGSVNTGVVVVPGETAYVKGVAADAGAVLGPVVSDSVYRPLAAPTVSEVQAEGHDDTADIDWELRWVNEGSTNSTDHDLTVQYMVDGVVVEQQTGISVDESQPYSHSTTGAGGLPGGELGSAKFLLELKSNNRPVDTQESRGLVLTT